MAPSRSLTPGPAERLEGLRQRFPFLPATPGDIERTIPETEDARDVLLRLEEGLAHGGARLRDDLLGGGNLAGGSGGQRGRFLELGEDFLKAHLDRRYESPAAAAPEVEAERERRRLGIYPPRRVWFLSRGGDGTFWACSLSPRLETLRERFNREFAAGAMKTAWGLYLEAFCSTFDLATSAGVWLDCNPNNFGLAGKRMYYIDDDVTVAGSGVPAFGTQALLRLREYSTADLCARRRFLAGFAALIECRERRELEEWRLAEDFAVPLLWPREGELREIIERLRGFMESL